MRWLRSRTRLDALSQYDFMLTSFGVWRRPIPVNVCSHQFVNAFDAETFLFCPAFVLCHGTPLGPLSLLPSDTSRGRCPVARTFRIFHPGPLLRGTLSNGASNGEVVRNDATDRRLKSRLNIFSFGFFGSPTSTLSFPFLSVRSFHDGIAGWLRVATSEYRPILRPNWGRPISASRTDPYTDIPAMSHVRTAELSRMARPRQKPSETCLPPPATVVM